MGGRGSAAEPFIVNANEILNDHEIRQEVFNYKKLAFNSSIECIRWCARHRLIHNTLICTTCEEGKSFVGRRQLQDGFHWKCRICRSGSSIRTGSFFARSHLSLEQIVTIVYGWARNDDHYQITREAECALSSDSTNTIVDWSAFCREVCQQYLFDHPSEIGGLDENGEPKIVEIDGSKIFHRKYNRGQRGSGHWVFGGIERGTGQCFMVDMPDQAADTLTNIIRKFILPGTIIVSDGSRTYRNINQIGGGIYQHEVVIHEDDPNIHVSDMENMWMRTKRKLRSRFGTAEELFVSHLHEYIWRTKFDHVRPKYFNEFLLCIAQQYPV